MFQRGSMATKCIILFTKVKQCDTENKEGKKSCIQKNYERESVGVDNSEPLFHSFAL